MRVTLKKVAAVSITVNVLLLAVVVYQQVGYSSLTNSLASLNQNLTSEVVNLRQARQQLENQLAFYKKQIEDLTVASEKTPSNQTLGKRSGSSVNIAAVQTLANGSMKGVIMKAEVEMHPGSGRVLVNIVPEVGFDLQTSVISGVKVVEDITGLSLNSTDIIVTIKSAGKVDAVDGPSAGAALTIGMLAAVRHKEINDKIFITGTINRDGSIGRVGGVLAKALAAASTDASVFLVPAGQRKDYVLVSTTRQIAPGFILTETRSQPVDIQDYLSSKGYSTKIVEVKTIKEAFKIMTEG